MDMGILPVTGGTPFKVTKEMTLKDKLDVLASFVKEQYQSRGRMSLTLVTCQSYKNGEYGEGVMEIPDFLLEERHKIIRQLGHSLAHEEHIKEIDTVGICSEAWFSMPQKEEAEKFIKEGKTLPMPSQDPNRREGVMVSLMDEKGDAVMRIFEIKRGEGRVELSLLQELENREGAELKASILEEFWAGYMHVK